MVVCVCVCIKVSEYMSTAVCTHYVYMDEKVLHHSTTITFRIISDEPK